LNRPQCAFPLLATAFIDGQGYQEPEQFQGPEVAADRFLNDPAIVSLFAHRQCVWQMAGGESQAGQSGPDIGDESGSGHRWRAADRRGTF
jgi:hypothetical protein